MKYVIILLLTVVCTQSFSNTLEKCLSNASETVKSCADKNIKNLTLNNCFAEAVKIKSDLSKENFKQFCFYQVSEFPTITTCMNASEKMIIAINHDEAVFECVRQFQEHLTENQCRKISEKLKYADKAKHLNRLCDQL